MSGYKLAELANAVGMSPRTVRLYVKQGMLPAPVFRGWATTYSEECLVRLRAIRRLRKEERLGLDEVRRRVAKSSLAELAALAGEPPRPPAPASAPAVAPASAPAGAAPPPGAAPPAGAPPPPGAPTSASAPPAEVAPVPAPDESSPATFAASTPASDAVPAGGIPWERFDLLPGLELHLRSDAAPIIRRIAAEIRAHYGSSNPAP